MANSQHYEILFSGVDKWNLWRKQNPDVKPDLSRDSLRKRIIYNKDGSIKAIRDPFERITDNLDLSGINFSKTDLHGRNLSGAYLPRSDLTGANLFSTMLVGANLDGAVLEKASLMFTDLSLASLKESNFYDASISISSFQEANLRGSKMRASTIDRCLFVGSDLTETDLRGATIFGGDFRPSETVRISEPYSGADVNAAMFGDTCFLDLDFRQFKNLEFTKHENRSYLSFESLYKSQAEIPTDFLRGIGFPEALIEYLPSLVNSEKSIQFHSVFISYSTEDIRFVNRLFADLQNAGVRCWFAPHNIKGGEKIFDQIDRAIQFHDKLLLVLSESSMKSEWVNTEIYNAHKRELLDDRRVLFPVRLVSFEKIKNWKAFDADTGKDLARELREYFIPDFSDWGNRDSYRDALDKLLRDLRI